MRVFHLSGLRGVRAQRLSVPSEPGRWLVLPAWLPVGDREIILDFYQAHIASEALERLSVDWQRELLDVDARYLDVYRARHGADAALLVVHLLAPGIDVTVVQAERALQQFDHVALVAHQPASNETFGALMALTHLVAEALRDRYEELAEEAGLGIRTDATLAELVSSLVNPLDGVEAYNALVDVQIEGISPTAMRDAIHFRLMLRLLGQVSDRCAAALALVATGGAAQLAEQDEDQAAQREMRERMLVRDGVLTGWAVWLRERAMWAALRERLKESKARSQLAVAAVAQLEQPGDEARWHRGDFGEVWSLLQQGRLSDAESLLHACEIGLLQPGVSDERKGNYWDAVGRLRSMQSRWTEAEPAFRRALELLERGAAQRGSRAATMVELAKGLRDNGRPLEAREAYAEARRLYERGGADRGVESVDRELAAAHIAEPRPPALDEPAV